MVGWKHTKPTTEAETYTVHLQQHTKKPENQTIKTNDDGTMILSTTTNNKQTTQTTRTINWTNHTKLGNNKKNNY